jgi:chemotaxis protein methyltransferase WspC
MILGELQELLKQTMGLDAASIGASAIERAVQERAAACELEGVEAYRDHLRRSKTELQQLIEAIVVPETWFFRDPEAFAAMERIVREERLPENRQGPLSLLSLPCSTGEEPYSMAMALLDAGVPSHRFRIDAVDISASVLERAAAAVYGKNSFRGNALGFRNRHFELLADGHRVVPAVRERVRFLQGNLFDLGLLLGVAAYDVIFCRNLLIYFDRPGQERALRVLTGLLTATGLLFVGPSEAGLVLSNDFVSLKIPLAFAFRKAGVKLPSPVAPIAAPVKSSWVPKPPGRPAATPGATRPPDRSPTTTEIEEMQRLADQGHLAEAAQACERYLRERGPSPQAFYLLGLIRDAGGCQADAVTLYRKALYLDPRHEEALVHLALLLEREGDLAGARMLRMRARRSEEKRGR